MTNKIPFCPFPSFFFFIGSLKSQLSFSFPLLPVVFGYRNSQIIFIFCLDLLLHDLANRRYKIGEKYYFSLTTTSVSCVVLIAVSNKKRGETNAEHVTTHRCMHVFLLCDLSFDKREMLYQIFIYEI